MHLNNELRQKIRVIVEAELARPARQQEPRTLERRIVREIDEYVTRQLGHVGYGLLFPDEDEEN